MDQASLYRCVRSAGADVLVFEDHPGFFGNWRVGIRKGSDHLEVVCDHREGWLTLLRGLRGQRQESVHAVRVQALDDEGILGLVGTWLA